MGSRKISSTLVWVLFGIILLSGCGEKGADNPVRDRQKTLIMHLQSDPIGMCPINSIGADAAYIHSLIFDHLIALDFQSLALKPQLAEAMPKVSPDRKSMTFKLRPGLKFADDNPLTAKDVEFSFKALMNPFVDSAPKRAELQNFRDCQAIDERTVVFGLANSGPFDLNRMAINFFVLPKHIFDPNDLTDAYTAAEASFAEKRPDSISPDLQMRLMAFANFFDDEKFQREKGFVVGSGRYIFDGWVANQNIRLVKNPNYWGRDMPGAAHAQEMDTLIYKTIPNLQTALQSLKSGEIDFGDKFSPEQFQDKMSGPDFERFFGKHDQAYPYYEYIGWNSRIRNHPERTFFSDARIRMALSQLVDVDEIISNIMFGTARPITSMVYADRPEYNKTLQPITYNEEAAKAMLFEAGWSDTDGDGILDKTEMNQKVDFSFTLSYRQGNEIRERIARHVKNKLKKVGIEVEVQSLDWSVMLDRLKKHELDAWLGAWVYDSDEQDLYSLFHSSQIMNDGYNWTGFNNPLADATMEAIVHTWDQGNRFELHRKIQKILYEEQPYTLLFANSARIGYNKRVKTDHWYGQRPCYHPGEFHLSKSPD